MLGKTMETEPQIIIMDEPTRGIDVGTKQQIYHIIAALAAEGKSIILDLVGAAGGDRPQPRALRDARTGGSSASSRATRSPKRKSCATLPA